MLIIFWISLFTIIVIRYFFNLPPELQGTEFINIDAKVSTFPRIKDKKQIIKVEVENPNGFKEVIQGQAIQIMTSLNTEYQRGDLLNIQGKLNNSGFIFYPKIFKKSSESNLFIKSIDYIRNILEQSIQKNLPEPHATLAIGMLLGSNKSLPKEIDASLKKTSMTHMIVVSGFNITLVTLLFINLSGIIHRKIALTTAIIATVIFVILAGINPPALRAGIMATITLTGQLLGRQLQTTYTLILAAAVMLLIDPQLIHSLSFQLSFTATLGVLALPIYIEKINKKLFKKSDIEDQQNLKFKDKAFNYLNSELSATLGAQIAVNPLLAKTFGTLSLVGPLANILVSWAVPIIMVLTFFLGIAGLFSQILAKIIAFFLIIFTAYFLKVAEVLGSIPYASLDGLKINWVVVGIYYSLIGLFIAKYAEHKK